MKNLGYIAGEITKGKNLSENLLKYGNGMCSMYNGLGFIKMSMNYYTVLDIARDLQNDKDLLNMINRLNELVERFVREFRMKQEPNPPMEALLGELKEQGYQLKAIRGILGKVEENQKTEPEALLEAQAQAVFRETGTGERNMSRQENMEMKKNTEVENKETELPQAEVSQPLAGEKMRQFQEIMNHVIGRAIEENSEKLSQDVSYLVHDKLMKELEYLMRVSDEREEERFKRLDEVIRAYQRENQGRAEAAAAAPGRFPFFRSRVKKKKFGRNGNKM